MVKEPKNNFQLDTSNIEFRTAFDLIRNTNQSLCLSGKAGTGKTTFLRHIQENIKKNIVTLAPTGVAAINARGQTIHSFFQIRPGVYVPGDKRLRTKALAGERDGTTIYDIFKYNSEKREVLKGIELLIIDEVSMVRADLLDVVDQVLRVFRGKQSTPFGGVQLLLIGDSFQLAPIARNDEWDILSKYYESPYFFSSQALIHFQPLQVELKKIYRQNELDFIDLLNQVRVGNISRDALQRLNSRYNPSFSPSESENYIILATHNKLVNDTNSQKLDALQGELRTFDATVTGDFPAGNMPTERFLKLKEGAQVMFVRNDPEKRYYNGKIGLVKKLKEDEITISFDNGTTVNVDKCTWKNIRFTWDEKSKQVKEDVLGEFTQYPLKLAWAITVHKSQGLTFTKVIADVGRSFAAGQVYVALSRCTSFEGLILKSQIGESAVITDESVVDYSKREASAAELENYLKEAEADMYYEKSRGALKKGDYEGLLDNLTHGLSKRNDLETSVFRRYFLAVANRFAFFKDRFNQRDGISQEFDMEDGKNDEYSIDGKTKVCSEESDNLISRLKNIEDKNMLLDAKRVMLSKSLKSVQSQNKLLLEEREELDFKLAAQLAITEMLEKEADKKEKEIKSLKQKVEDVKNSNAAALAQNKKQTTEIERLNKEVDIYRLKLREIGDLKKQLIVKDEEIKQLKEQTWLQKLLS